MRRVALLLAACAATPPRQLDVRITNLPARPHVTCYLNDAPEAPAPLELDFSDDDVIRRTTVNIRSYNELLEWAMALASVVNDQKLCIEEMTK